MSRSFQYFQPFDIPLGVKQGEPLLSVLFILFVNDMHSELPHIDDRVRLLENIYLFMLMYAEGTILFSKSETGVQTLVNKLSTKCDLALC